MYDINGNVVQGAAGGSTSGRQKIDFIYRGGVINCRYAIDNAAAATTSRIIYEMPTGDSDRFRLLYAKGAGTTTSLVLEDGNLVEGDGLVYDDSAKTIVKKNGTWGNISLSTNEHLLLYNSKGNLSGELSKYCSFGSGNAGFPICDIDAEQISSTGSTQGIVMIDDTVFTCSHSADGHTDFAGKIGSKSHNIGHMNAPDYSSAKDMLIVGNGSKSYTLKMEGYIFPHFKSVFNSSTQIDFNAVDKIILDFTDDIFAGEYKAQLCWAYDDYVFMSTSDCRIIRKLKLATGTTQGAYGNYVPRGDNGHNGTFDVVGTWYNKKYDVVGGMIYRNGNVYFGVKGEYGIRKCILKSDGFFDSVYIRIKTLQGDMQGLALSGGYCYAYSDYKGWKFDEAKL